MSRVKIVVIAVVALLMLIIVLQNTATVETKLLFISVSMPRAAMLFGNLLIGFVLGVLTSNRILRRR